MAAGTVVKVVVDAVEDFEDYVTGTDVQLKDLLLVRHPSFANYKGTEKTFALSTTYIALGIRHVVTLDEDPTLPHKGWDLRKVDKSIVQVFHSKTDLLDELRMLGVPTEKLKVLRKLTVAELRRYAEEGEEDGEKHAVTVATERELPKEHHFKLSPPADFWGQDATVTIRCDSTTGMKPVYTLAVDWTELCDARERQLQDLKEQAGTLVQATSFDVE
jgi:hypothetical protein